MANPGAPKYKDIPLGIVGSTKFGQYPFISSEQTFNMVITDGYYSNFAGFKLVAAINPHGKGRAIYTSTKLGKMFAVIDNGIYTFDASLTFNLVGTTTTTFGDVFISENNNANGEVVFSDSVNLYVYVNSTNSVTTLLGGGTQPAQLGFVPGYLTYQNGRIISPDLSTNQWRLSSPNEVIAVANWPDTAQYVGAIQTKPDFARACKRFPGLGNLLFVYGNTVTEPWQDVGATLFPYQRSTSSNIDYGCLNPATIDDLEDTVCWLGVNDKAGPVIMYSNGRTVDHLSTDGIDFLLDSLTNPIHSYGFMFKQYGHLFYVITFPDDNVTYVYDWKTKQFFTLTDEKGNYFPAKKVAFFNNEYYFVSINDGNIYQFGEQFQSYNYGPGNDQQIPRMRICPEIKLPDQSYFISGYAGFKIESGITNQPQTVAMSFSKDSGSSFSSQQTINLFGLGRRQNRLMFWNQGMSNTLTFKFNFEGFQRFLLTEGVCGVFQ